MTRSTVESDLMFLGTKFAKLVLTLFLSLQLAAAGSWLLLTPALAGDDHERTMPHLFVGQQQQLQTVVGRRERRALTVNQEALRFLAANRTETITLPVAGEEMVFYRDFQQGRGKNSTWRGRDKEGRYRVVLTLGADHFFGKIVGPDKVYNFEPGTAELEIVSYEADFDYETPLVNDTMALPSTSASTSSEMVLDAADDGSQIDMLILYTDGLAAVYPGSQMATRIQYLIDLANDSFSNSEINTSFNLVYSQQVDYPDDSIGDMDAALTELTNNSGVFSGVEALRTTYGADQVTLLRRYVDEGCGVAWVLTTNEPRYAYAVVQDGYRSDNSGYYCDELSYIHEVGHNLGCAHDRDNSTSPGRYSYSYGYQEPNRTFRTVMAYDCPGGCPRIGYFSNPYIYYDGKATGINYLFPNSADNAKTINQTRLEMAQFRTATPSSYGLSVALSGLGSGSVSSSPAGISCGSDCWQEYDVDTAVTLTATPATGSYFQGWSGSCSGGGSCTVTMNQAQSVTASFAKTKVNLAISKTGDGTGTVSSSPAGISCGTDCSEAYDYNTVVSLSATPDSGSYFAGWSGSCSGLGSCSVTMSQSRAAKANFTKIKMNLSVSKDGDGTGTVSSDPAGISCGTDCTESYTLNTVVTLSAAPDSGSYFSGWSGGCSGQGSCSVTMSQAQSVSATFKKHFLPPILYLLLHDKE